MSAKKLSDADKKEILEQYRQPGETTSTLARRYSVSNSTISRLLKSSFSPDEYEQLIQQKRALRSNSGQRTSARETPQPAKSPSEDGEQLSLEVGVKPRRRRRKRVVSRAEESREDSREESREPSRKVEAPVLRHELAPEKSSPPPTPTPSPSPEKPKLRGTTPPLTVSPLAEATLPKTCYLVVDRASELIARPLKEFDDLGPIPTEEVSAKTLPVFDNHRVARRFANRSQRVMKVPDSRMLHKVGSHLQAKGITRIFFDGHVYSL
ncbi:transposase [Baaleninema sp.]|uniref:transposase n=1 Tax=Baaleninema sp. TaxID=3101197 RepID=UPI003D045BB9